MELRRYIEIFQRRWWLVVGATIITALVTSLFVVRQPWVYESSGTYVVRPRSIESDEVVRAFDTLNRGVEINSTYARIAESELIEDRAKGDLDEEVPTGVNVDAEVLVGTNILEITVSGQDPDGVHAMAQAVGSATVEYVAELDDVFGLVPLDSPDRPNTPSSPNKPLTITLGTFLGLLLGLGLAVLGEYVGSPTRVKREFDIMDPTTGAHTEEFFKLRFRQELSRTKHSGQKFSLGVLKVDDERRVGSDGKVPSEEDLWKIARELENDLREEDVIAYIGEGTFTVMIPDLPVEDAERLLVTWQDLIRAQGPRRQIDGSYAFDVSFGVCEYGSDTGGREWSEDEIAHVL